ncbi:MAG: phospholipase D-like domain-containing protein [Longimicrobiales bacterium]
MDISLPLWADLLVAASVLLFAWIGVQFLTRGNPVAVIRRLERAGGATGIGDPLFRRTIEAHLNTTFRDGNAVDVLDNGAVFERLFTDLRAARDTITWHVFWFKPGRLADEVGAILHERARAGVTVLFLRDAFGSRARWGDYFERLRVAGVDVATFRPLSWRTLYKVQQRSHMRAVVIDGVIGYTGGFAIDDRWRGDGRQPGAWRDTSARFRGPVVAQLQSSFAADWAEATGELIVGDRVFPRATEQQAGDSYAGLLYSAPSLGSTDAERYFALAIAGARESLYITNAYFIPDDDFRGFLIDAVSRGVDVRILTPGANTDKKAVWYAGRRHFEPLLAAGVRIYEYRPTMVHAKTLVADRCWSSIGTINFDNRSLSLNDEVALLVHDRKVAEHLHDRFLADLELADPLDLETFRRRAAVGRLLERLAVLFARLL